MMGYRVKEDNMESVSLKEYFEKILEEKDKALNAALIAVKEEGKKTEIAAEKRFDLLNELRSGVATKEQLESLEKLVEDVKDRLTRSEGKGAGSSASWGILVTVISISIAVISLLSRFIK